MFLIYYFDHPNSLRVEYVRTLVGSLGITRWTREIEITLRASIQVD